MGGEGVGGATTRARSEGICGIERERERDAARCPEPRVYFVGSRRCQPRKSGSVYTVSCPVHTLAHTVSHRHTTDARERERVRERGEGDVSARSAAELRVRRTASGHVHACGHMVNPFYSALTKSKTREKETYGNGGGRSRGLARKPRELLVSRGHTYRTWPEYTIRAHSRIDRHWPYAPRESMPCVILSRCG